MVIYRMDYLMDVPTNTVKLVEYNTIATGCGILTNKVKYLQKYINDKYNFKQHYPELQPSAFAEDLDKKILDYGQNSMKEYENRMIQDFAHAIQLYKDSLVKKFNRQSSEPWVLFIIEEKERNVVDQKIIEV